LIKYLSNKTISNHHISALPPSISSNLTRLPNGDILLKELPLSLLVDLCKNNKLDLDSTAISALNYLLSDILKPKNRNLPSVAGPPRGFSKNASSHKNILRYSNTYQNLLISKILQTKLLKIFEKIFSFDLLI
jgi:hypothetical protein